VESVFLRESAGNSYNRRFMSSRDRSDDLSAPRREAIATPPKPAARRELGGLFEQVYAKLRAMAQLQMRKEHSAHTLQATELVHQAS
jgi:hypothetical protein